MIPQKIWGVLEVGEDWLKVVDIPRETIKTIECTNAEEKFVIGDQINPLDTCTVCWEKKFFDQKNKEYVCPTCEQ